jgi:DoxX-like family
MFAAAAVASVLLAVLLAYSALTKLSHQERFVQGYLRVGVPEDKLDYLAIVLLAGVAGLLLGLLWAPIGVAAAIGVVLYFLVAIAFHIRADDAEHLPTPLVLALLAGAALGLRAAAL